MGLEGCLPDALRKPGGAIDQPNKSLLTISLQQISAQL
jgi:hypothetical protein